MPDFNLQPNFPIASIAQLYANKSAIEAQNRLEQQKLLNQGFETIGKGISTVVDRRNAMAQALASATTYAQMHPDIMGPTQQTTQSPVMRNQTAAFDPETGSVTPNTGMSGVGSIQQQTTSTPSPLNMQTLQQAFMGLAPKDLIDSATAGQSLKIAQGHLSLEQTNEPKKIAIEAQRAAAETENASVMRQIQAMLAANTIKNQGQERAQATENAALDANKETAKHWLLHPVDAYRASNAISAAGHPQSGTFALPGVGESVTHPSGVVIKRVK